MENIENKIKRIKTVKSACQAIRELDGGTAISEWFIRCLCKDGKVQCFFTGKKILLNYDHLLEVLNFETAELKIKIGGGSNE